MRDAKKNKRPSSRSLTGVLVRAAKNDSFFVSVLGFGSVDMPFDTRVAVGSSRGSSAFMTLTGTRLSSEVFLAGLTISSLPVLASFFANFEMMVLH